MQPDMTSNIKSHTHSIGVIPMRMALMRLNRILAWALMVSPLVQFIFKVTLPTSLQIDLGLMLTHGALSLVLFGVPKVRGREFVFSMHVLGGRPADLSARNRFLLSGYRIALGMTSLLLFVPARSWFVLVPFVYSILRLPVSVIEHIDVAIQYALGRWGLNKALAGLVVFVYLFAVVNNFIRALFGAWL